MRFWPLLLLALACGAPSPALSPPAADPPAAKRIAPSRDYPLTACVVSEQPLDSQRDRRGLLYEAREVQVCCETCQSRFQAEPEAYMPRFLRWMKEVGR